MENHIFYFLPAGEPKENEPIQKYANIFSNVGLDHITTVTYGKIRNRESFFLLPELFGNTGRTTLLIPAVLDMFNALSYDGVEYAMRIYFNFVMQNSENFQIAILGTEEESAFWRHCKYSSFLKCPHVSFIINNVYAIKDYLKSNLIQIDNKWTMDWDDCRATLKTLNIAPPASYKTHHSITNEWSIYRWSMYVGMGDIPISKDIKEFLYFNYLKAIYPESVLKETQLTIEGNGRILLVDDECCKGWHQFFETLFNNNPSITFNSIGGEFKNISPNEIIQATISKINAFLPSVVILDLRLHDSDFDEKQPEELIGFKIYKEIKDKINRGIQIIAFSASNKVWNYLPLTADGVIVKESPEKSVDNHSTPNSIIKLKENVERSLKRANSLIPIYNKLQNIKQLYRQYKCFNDDKLQEIDSNIDVAYELLDKNDLFKYNKYYAFSYLQLYIVIEKFLQEKKIYFRNEPEKKAIVLDKFIVARWEQLDKNLTITDYAIKRVGNRYTLGIDKSNTDKKDFTKETNFIMSSLLLMGYGFKDLKNSPWPEINNIRNTKAGHPEKGELQEFEYMQLVDFLTFIFDKNNLNLASLDNSLPDNKEIYAIITVAKGPIQARIDEDNDKKSYPLSFKKEKPHLRLGDKIVVELIRKNNQIIGLNYVK